MRKDYTTPLAVLVAVLFCLALGWAWPAEAAPSGTTCTGALCQVDATGDVRVSDGAATEVLEFELVATTAIAGLSAGQQLAAAKAFYCENRSSATCYVSLDAQTLTTTGSSGWKFAAGTERTWNVDGSVFGPLVRVACTADTATGSAFWCAWLK